MNYKKEKREESLKIAVNRDYFSKYIYKQLGNIDFVIAKNNLKNGQLFLSDEYAEGTLKSILWAEAKLGTNHDIYESFVQLILTIGKEKTFEKYLPPKFIGAFDAEKFAFIEYHKIQDVFYQNDFNWNVTPSNHETKEFKQLYNLCKNILEDNSILFFYDKDEKEFKDFINLNFKNNNEITEKISVTRNNFTFVFQRWLEKVKPTIEIDDWDLANKEGIMSADFFLADLISDNNMSIKDNLNVVLKQKEYYYNKERKRIGGFSFDTVGFNDKQKAHKEFWNIYKRPPKEEYWEYMTLRRDLLVPQNIREIKGSYFTPKIWVEKSQQYLADVLGENWQDEYYIWDCCAGTGNLLNGLTNKRNIWASTLDKADVDIMKDTLKNVFEDHIFQFDFLNDDFISISDGGKVPDELEAILNDEEKRKKLVIYINPPYGEAGNKRQTSGSGKNKENLSKTRIADKYSSFLGKCKNELFAQFHIRIKKEINSCFVGSFSTLIFFSGANFNKYRQFFNGTLENAFVVPSNTFDNITGDFPIGFFIWNLSKDRIEKNIKLKFFTSENKFIEDKRFSFFTNEDKTINQWISTFEEKEDKESLGVLMYDSSDFQANDKIVLTNKCYTGHHHYSKIFVKNIIPYFVFFSVRKCIEHSWINHNYQFIFPLDTWKNDKEFITDSIIFVLFNGKNNISVVNGINHFIPFTEQQVGCKKSFKSHFMSDFLQGKVKIETEGDMFTETKTETVKIELTPVAKSVYDSGLELWKYYHSQPRANNDASFYDIREYFQGKSNGKMKTKSDDEKYTELISDLRNKMKLLAKQIEPKVYEYGFLKA